MGIAVGIDLGTTNSCMAVVQGDRAKIVENQSEQRIHPSVVSFLPDGTTIAGHRAKERQIIDPAGTVYSFKRLLGRDLGSPEMQKVVQDLPYKVQLGAGDIPTISIHDREVTLPEVSAMMLRHLRETFSETYQQDINEAVITVPANFNDVQRASTKVAGRIAGFNVLRILNEPTAAALAYGFGGEHTERIAIYDYGGGTFDITIVEIVDDIFEVLSTAGDTFLGGDDFDSRIVDKMVEDFKAQHKIDPTVDPIAYQRIRAVAEWVKKQLSTLEEVQSTLREIARAPSGELVDFHFRLSRRQFEDLTESLVDKSLTVCDEALKLAGLDRTALDNLILVGGTTRIPLVRQKVGEYFEMVPRSEINPDEVVAIGAAIQAFSLTGEQLPEMSEEFLPPPVEPEEARLSEKPNPLIPSLSPANPLSGIDAEVHNIPPRQEVSTPPEPLDTGNLEGETAIDNDSLFSGVEFDIPSTKPAPEQSEYSSQPEYPAYEESSDAIPAVLETPSQTPANPIDQISRKVSSPPPPPSFIPVQNPTGTIPPPPVDPFADVGVSAFGVIETPLTGAKKKPRIPMAVPVQETKKVDILPMAVPVPPKTSTDANPAPTAPSAKMKQHQESVKLPKSAALKPALLLDVTPRALGVATAGGFCDTIIERNAAIPVEQSRLFTTSSDDQIEVSIDVYQGESRRTAENTPLGKVTLSQLRPAPRGEIKIRVTFEIDTDGIMGISARNEETGEAEFTRIVLTGGMDDEQVEALVQKYANK